MRSAGMGSRTAQHRPDLSQLIIGNFMPVLFQFPDSLLRLCECIHPRVNVGFFHGAAVGDPARLLHGTGKFMCHVKLAPGTATSASDKQAHRDCLIGYPQDAASCCAGQMFTPDDAIELATSRAPVR
jgi:hypothetical protein